MAEYLLAERGQRADVQISSAGTHALVGRGAEDHAIAVMQQHGIDMRAHIARQATPDLVMRADLVLSMEVGQQQWLLQHVPAARGRVQMITRWTALDEVPDPYLKPREAYIETFALLEQCIGGWLERL